MKFNPSFGGVYKAGLDASGLVRHREEMNFPHLWPTAGRLCCRLILAGFPLSIFAADAELSLESKPEAMQFISATDARFVYEGRFDLSPTGGPVVIWQGSRISLDFEGRRLALRFTAGKGQNFFNVQVDDAPPFMISVPVGRDARIELGPFASEGFHKMVLFKRSEAAAGTAQFTGAEIEKGAQTSVPADSNYKVRMEFFGDSITVGACNEDGATDQWDDRRSHNNALSYATLTAGAFHADYRCIAVSGMGVAAGYVEVKAGEVWDRIYPEANSAKADLTAWQPDVVFVNFGENDDSFSRGQHQPFPVRYVSGYVALVKAMRAAYPHVHFVLLRGGMYGGSQSEPLREAWNRVVKELESIDPAVSHFVFTHWSSNHPRVADDQALADELVSWLKQQAFMHKFI